MAIYGDPAQFETTVGPRPDERRVMRVLIGSEFLAALMTPGPWSQHIRCTHGLPSGARLVGARVDEGCLVTWWHHESFDPYPQPFDLQPRLASHVCPPPGEVLPE